MGRNRPAIVAGSGGYVAYYRVSTDQQARSGLGLAAQRDAVQRHLYTLKGHLVGEFEETESGKRDDRPQLAAALAACRAKRATLVIAKLDRLARNARFLLDVVDGCGDGGVAFCDLPQIPPGAVGKFMVTLLAAVAELEAGLISQRTKAALQAAKARGVKLGGPNLCRGNVEASRRGREAQTTRSKAHAEDVRPFIEQARSAGAYSLRDLAKALIARGVRTPSGGTEWTPTQVQRVVMRIAEGTPQWAYRAAPCAERRGFCGREEPRL